MPNIGDLAYLLNCVKLQCTSIPPCSHSTHSLDSTEILLQKIKGNCVNWTDFAERVTFHW